VRLFRGPVIDRTRERPHFVATPEVIHDDCFRAWFTSCARWENTPDGPKHYYNLEYAESSDGIQWKRDGKIAIDFADEHEYALGVPRVIKDSDGYKMWFCSRATSTQPPIASATLNQRTALTGNGLRMGPVSTSRDHGWDSEMVCYPYVFDHAGSRYMLYNGNGYGRTGFGIAILER
jgi:hypothetical protein